LRKKQRELRSCGIVDADEASIAIYETMTSIFRKLKLQMNVASDEEQSNPKISVEIKLTKAALWKQIQMKRLKAEGKLDLFKDFFGRGFV
jgi:hypothetical protein